MQKSVDCFSCVCVLKPEAVEVSGQIIWLFFLSCELIYNSLGTEVFIIIEIFRQNGWKQIHTLDRSRVQFTCALCESKTRTKS